ncbi:MAG: hypothetical protein GY850_44475, partial [bacterium]|nr:hypothetical protein [bacterium]
MSKQDICRTIVFARIANKPQLNELFGKEDATHFSESCISYLSTIARQHKGTIVKTQYEGLMCRFQNADDAVIAGKAMHQDLMYIKISDRPGAPPPNISIGINTDAANKKNDKDSATTEKAVAKLAAIGPSGQIITTKKVVTHLAADIKPFVRPFNPNTANGKNGKMKLYDIVWSTE